MIERIHLGLNQIKSAIYYLKNYKYRFENLNGTSVIQFLMKLPRNVLPAPQASSDE